MITERLSAVWPDWKITEQIGEGSFGKVYKAVREDASMTTFAAIKVISIPQNEAEVSSLRSEGMDEAASRTYFQGIVNDCINEIKVMESMKGTSNIVSVEDYKMLEREDRIGWDIFIRMELLTPFNDYAANKNLSEADVIKLGTDICSALELCAQRNVIHRDIKPENIFVSSFGDFKVGDFGIAKELEKTGGSFSSKGTFSYMAPEVSAGKDYNASVDIYSLGLMLYKLLNNNRLPFLDPYAPQIQYQDRKNATDRRLNGEALPAPVNASERMANIILTACAFDPKKRFATPTAFKNALLAVSAGANAEKVTPVKKVDLDATAAVRRAPSSTPEAQNPISQVQSFDNSGTKKDKKEKKAKKKKSKAGLILILILILALVGGGIYGYFALKDTFDPSTKVIDALAEGDFDSALELYEELGEVNDTLVDGLKSRLDTAYSSFKDGTIDYITAKKEIDTITDMDVSEVSGKLAETKSKVEDLNRSKTAFDTAAAFETSGQFESAIAQYKKVIEDDTENYETAQTKLTSVIEKYRTQVLEDAAEYVDVNDYESALKTLNKALTVLENDSEITTQITVYSTTYESSTLTEADKLISASKFDEAKSLLANAERVLPSSTKITEKLNSIDSLRPVSLDKLVVVDSSYYEYKEEPFTDSFGNTYSNYFKFDGWGSEDIYAIYNLGNQYTTFNASIIASPEMSSDGQITISVYVDDVLKYTKSGYMKTSDRFDFAVDVSGGKILKIKADFSDYHDDAYITNASLSKK